MNIEEGKYIIRCFCFLNDDSTFSYLSGPPVAPRDQTVEESMTTCIYATVKNIVRADMREKIKERHLEPECFVQVIRRDNGTILLRQTATTRYASIDHHDPTWPTYGPEKRWYSADESIISFFYHAFHSHWRWL